MTHNLEKSHFPIWLVWPKWFDSANQVLFFAKNRKFKNTSFYTSFDAEFHADSESVKIFKKFQILDPILVKKLIFWGRFSTLMGRFLILRSIKIGQPIHHSNQHQILFKMRYRLTWFSDHPLKNDQNSNFQNSKTCLSLRGHISALESKSKNRSPLTHSFFDEFSGKQTSLVLLDLMWT